MSILNKNKISIWLAASLLLPAFAQGACMTGDQSSGAKYLICVPESGWNGDLVVYAHGYVAPQLPVGIPEDQLKLPDGTYLPDLITDLRFAFATTSFSTNGLAVPEGVEDVRDLVSIFKAAHPGTLRVFVTGVSEGALVAVKAMEAYPSMFNGGLAACGPIGDFRKQIDHVGDVRVVFDYFFPDLLPGSAINIPGELMDGWEGTYESRVLQGLQRRPLAAAQLISVTDLPLGLNPANAGDAVTSVLWYNVFGTNDAKLKLGGNPFDNKRRWYTGSLSDLLLNVRVARFAAAPEALAAIQADYQTTGQLSRPLVTLHTTADPVVPFWHEARYAQRAAARHSSHLLLQLPVPRYGHCNFAPGEVLIGFYLLVLNPLTN